MGDAVVVRASEAVVTGMSTGLYSLAPLEQVGRNTDIHTSVSHTHSLCGFWEHWDLMYSALKASPYLSALFNYFREFEGPEG